MTESRKNIIIFRLKYIFYIFFIYEKYDIFRLLSKIYFLFNYVSESFLNFNIIFFVNLILLSNDLNDEVSCH